jgi:hypothetical protein
MAIRVLGALIFLFLTGLPGPVMAQEMSSDRTAGDEGEDEGAAQLDDGDRSEPPHDRTVFSEAERVLAAARSTSYSHRTRISERDGSFDVDCSGFAGYLLRRAAPTARRELVAATVKRPLARDFVAFLSQLPPAGPRGHWRRVDHALDVRPGDLVAWLRPADSHSKDTGHVLIVAGPPSAARGELHVPVIDSSALAHGDSDRRAADSATGVGRGTIVLRLDPDGRPRAFRWARERRYREHVTTIVLGRVEPSQTGR